MRNLFSPRRRDRDVVDRYAAWLPASPAVTRKQDKKTARKARRGGDTMGRPDPNPTARGEDFRLTDRGNRNTRRRARRHG